MNKIFVKLFLIFIFIYFMSTLIYPCTAFSIKNNDQIILGKNYDFNIGYCHITINKRNITKNSLVDSPEKSIKWTSKYGSVTFNQFGRELPNGGINEKGLVIEILMLRDTKYPEYDQRHGLREAQWIQYQLDNFASVDEVIASDKIIRISKISYAPVHFFICDKNGNAVTIEYLNGKMVYHTGKNLPYKILTNNTYKDSINYLKGFKDFGGNDPINYISRSLDRFAIAASMIKKFDNNKNIIKYSYQILNTVKNEESTQWSIVYDIKNMKIYYKTKNNQKERILNINDFDFSCETPMIYTDIETKMKKGKINFKKYSYKSNYKLLNDTFNNVNFLQNISVETRKKYARYPDTTKCSK